MSFTTSMILIAAWIVLVNYKKVGYLISELTPRWLKRFLRGAGGSLLGFLSRRFLNVLVAFAVLVCSGAAAIHFSEYFKQRYDHLIPGSDGWRDRRCERGRWFPYERVFLDEDGDGKRECTWRKQRCGSSSSTRLDEDGFLFVCDEGVWSCPTDAERIVPGEFGIDSKYLCGSGSGDWFLFDLIIETSPTYHRPPIVSFGDPGDDPPIEPPCVGDCTDMDGDGRTWNDVDADGDGFYEP